jgi:hypothetical protein
MFCPKKLFQTFCQNTHIPQSTGHLLGPNVDLGMCTQMFVKDGIDLDFAYFKTTLALMFTSYDEKANL